MESEQFKIAKARLMAYYEAEMAVLTGQSYTIGTRSLTRANLSEIRKAILELEKRVEELKSLGAGKGRRKAYRITPRDL
jgi:hypothetical protein